jgi:hypothetical protein
MSFQYEPIVAEYIRGDAHGNEFGAEKDEENSHDEVAAEVHLCE